MREVVSLIDIRGFGQADVACFTARVLGIPCATDFEVQLRAAVAHGDYDPILLSLIMGSGGIEEGLEGLENLLVELLYGRDVLRRNVIVDAKLGGNG